MKIIAEVLFLFTLFGFSSAFGMEVLNNTIDNPDMLENYLSNIHNQIRWSLYNHEPYKTMEGFYRWDESIGIFKGLPSFSVHLEKYRQYLHDREAEIQSIMVNNEVLKKYFIMLTEDERSKMRQLAFIWVDHNFPKGFLVLEQKEEKKEKKSLKTLFKKMKLHKK